VSVHVQASRDHVVVRIEDNGVGFDPSAVADRGGMGLTSMRERAEKMGATLRISASPGGGTAVEVRVARLARDGAPDQSTNGGGR
jgi:signal transduction histidine kinase